LLRSEITALGIGDLVELLETSFDHC